MSVPVDAPKPVSPLRVALVGCGKMGLHHLKAIAATKRAVVVGVADPRPPDELRAQLDPAAIVTATAAELYERARPDVVHIVTPPASHVDLALEAIAAGCHVYVEKPFTLQRSDAARVIEAAAAKGVSVCAGHQVLFEAPALTVRDRLPAIGRLVHVSSYFSFRMVRRTITKVDQTKDILPHAVYPVVQYLRLGTGITEAPIEISGLTVRADGGVYALTRLGDMMGVIVVTLSGRPIEQYHEVVGTNGSLCADGGSGAIRLVGQGAGPGALVTPYRRGWQTFVGGTRAAATRLLKGGSYPGLDDLFARFYDSLRGHGAPPLTPQSILDTVDLCERIGHALDEAERVQESAAQERLALAAQTLPPIDPARPRVLLTGGTGLLGRATAEELRHAGHPVRVVARRIPPPSARLAGVDYAAGDLGAGLDASLFDDVGVVVHCAAETSGGKAEHQRNSLDATRLLVEMAARHGVRAMVHVSSLAVLQTSRQTGGAIDERTPIDAHSETRGPYVWGKAESEGIARTLARDRNLPLKVVRPGPLVDYLDYQPPGRLGREMGPWFVAIGPRRGDLSVCDVNTAARVIRWYVQEFDAAPDLLNMVEAPPSTRDALMGRYLSDRPDLGVLWVPAWFLRLLSWPLSLVQRVVLGVRQPMDVAAAFASERYDTTVAARCIQQAGPSRVVRSRP